MQAVTCARALRVCTFKESWTTRMLLLLKRVTKKPSILLQILPLGISGALATSLLATFLWEICKYVFLQSPTKVC